MKHSQTVEITGVGDVEFTFSLYMESTGIGSYEYQGFRGYDHGVDYFEIEDYEWNESLYTHESNDLIKAFTQSKEWQEIEDKVCADALRKDC